MKNTIKKTGFLFLLTALLVLFAFSASAETYTGSCGDEITYSLDTETGILSIEGVGEMNDFSRRNSPWYQYRSYITTVKIDDAITTIGNWAFSGSSIESIILPKNLKTINPWAFRNCSSLKNINIPNNVKTIGAQAFYGCSSLESITLPEGLTDIFGETFRYCSNLESIYLPSTLKSIGGISGDNGGPFSECPKIKVIKVAEGNKYFCNDEYGALYNIDMTTLYRFPVSEHTSYEINENVKYIHPSAFQSCTHLEKVTLPNGITCIYDYTFKFCNKLKEINIPETVTKIGYEAFYSCESLEEVVIPGSVKEIDDSAFQYCSSLKTLTLCHGINNIGFYSFYSCENLKSVIFPDSLYAIPLFSFNFCSNLKNIIIAANTRVDSGAFRNCKLEHVGYKGTQEQWNDMNPGLSSVKYLHMNFNPETDITEVITPATCLKEGSKTTVCSCGYVYGEETLPVVDCSFTVYSSDSNATCLEDGTKTALCDYGCGSNNTLADEGSALGHDMSDFVVTKTATCTVNGEERADCSRCDYFEIKELIASNHTDSDHNGYCDDCKEFVADKNCNCVCHADGLHGFLYKLLWIIQKIFNVDLLKKVFGLGQMCRCGIAHY